MEIPQFAVLFLVVNVPVDRLCSFFVAFCVKTVEIPQDVYLAQCSLPLGQAHEAWRHGRYAQKDT